MRIQLIGWRVEWCVVYTAVKGCTDLLFQANARLLEGLGGVYARTWCLTIFSE
jgi:hypothetical protein